MAESSPSEQRLKLIQLLSALPKGDFEGFCFALTVPPGDIPSAVADQKSRAKALLDWVSGPNGCGWPTFLETLESIVPGEQFDPQDLAIAATSTAPNNTPLKGAHHFVGRDRDLARLHEQLQQSQPVAITAVVGMGGIGKTELALQYVRAHLADYPGGVCWLAARDQDITAQILAFAATHLGFTPADELPLEARITACWQQWPGQTQALVVIDDVTDYGQIEPYLPTNPRFTRLLTTRQQQLATTVTSLNIEVLTETNALELLKELAGADRIEAELDRAKHLCNWLGYLPLALELVGRYLARKPDLSLAELQTRLESKQLAARALAKAESGMTNAEGVASAFELSWQELSTEAQELALFLSCFALVPIPWNRVPPCAPEADPEDLEDWRDQELQQSSLLKRVESGRYQYHQLVQRFIRTKLSDDSPLIAAYCKAMVAATQEIDDTPTQAQCLAWGELVPHVAEATAVWLAQISDDDLIWPFVGLANFYEEQGLYEQADPWYEECLRVTRERLGDEHPDVATSLNNLAVIYTKQGRYSEAESFHQQALALWKRLLGDEHPDVATSLNNLALLYDKQGRYGEAESLHQQALALWKRLLGDEHPDVATSLNNLALLYRNQGRYSEAEPLSQQALTLWKRLLGDEHPDVAQSLNNLAMLYYHQGRYSDVEPLLQQALEMRQLLLGGEHPDVALSLNNLAMLYSDQGRYSDAEPLLQQALMLWKQRLGGEHPDVALSLNNLAMLYSDQGRCSEAEPLYLQAIEIAIQQLGENHPNTQIVLSGFASCIRKAIAAGQANTLSGHPMTQQILQQLCSQDGDGA
jgi:tetratricopeptide (TPR) repeat protein